MDNEMETPFPINFVIPWSTTISPEVATNIDLSGNQSNVIDNHLPLGYCGTGLKPFQKWYGAFHCYTSLAICLVGVIANTLNLIVFTRKSMKNPTNFILTGLAFVDLLKTLEYIPYAIYLTLPSSRSYTWAVYVLFHSNFSQICHTASILLTLTLAVWRYIMIANFGRGMTLCCMERARWAVAIAYVSSPLLCIPIYLSFSVKVLPDKIPIGNDTFSPEYVVNLSELADQNPGLIRANFWFYSVVIKIIPCVLLTVVSFCLIYSIIQAKKRKQLLLSKPAIRTISSGGNYTSGTSSRPPNCDSEAAIGSDLVTRMLLAVNLFFLLTEFPQGTLGLVSGMLGDVFFKTCYIPLSDVMDFLALLNSGLNFILYYLMSSKFRETVGKLFPIQSDKVVPAPHVKC